jgi:spiro-SPASM protein
LNIERSALSTELARRIFDEIANVDDLRLTLAGVGDPILSENFFEILDAASDAGVASVHVETDLFGIQGDPIKRLAESGVDVVSIHVPAATAQVYQQVMGADGLTQVIMNIRSLVEHRARRGRGTPLIVPTFIKCRENLGEMEIWYDRWLSALGSAVIVGPSDFCGQIPDFAVADMSPPRRKACARLKSRMSVLSDGSVVSCEQDVQGRHLLGNARTDSLAEIWQQKISAMLQDHRQGHWNKHSLCGGCREWHRP